MKRFYIRDLIYILLFIPFTVLSQNTVLTKASFLQKVSGNSTSIQIIREGNRVAEMDSKLAQSSLLPSVASTASYQRDFNSVYMYFDDAEEMLGVNKFKSNFSNYFNATVYVNQKLIDVTAWNELKIAKKNVEITSVKTEQQIASLLFEAANLYTGLLLLKEARKLAEYDKQLTDENAALAKTLLSQGQISEYEYNQAKLFAEKPRLTLVEIGHQYQFGLNQIKILAGIEPNETVELADTLSIPQQMLPGKPADNAVTNTYDYRLQQKGVEFREMNVSLAKSERLPKLSLNGGLNLESYSNKFKFENKNHLFFGQISLSIPIFMGNAIANNIKKAKIELRRKQRQQTLLISQKQNELQEILTTYATSQEKLKINEKTVNLAEKNLSIAKLQVQTGLMSQIDFKAARLNYLQAKSEYLNRIQELHNIIAKWNKEIKAIQH